jgi:predicted alpha/beta superfamily hydrolase
LTETLTIAGRNCRLFGSDHPDWLLVQPSARHETATLEGEAAQLAALTEESFVLATIELNDWIVDLMPWSDKNISREEEAGLHGQDTFQYVIEALIPALKQRYGDLPVILGGYSLGGLFALWAATRTNLFEAVAAASPSVWIKDWIPYATEHKLMARYVHLSLGEREEHVKNQAIARVGDCLREYYTMLKNRLGPDRCTLVWEEGNHFTDNEGRLARAFAWCLNQPAQPFLKNP